MANQSVQPFLHSSWQCRWAHCRHLANTIELVVALAYPSPQPKRQIVDRFSRFRPAHGRKSLYLTMGARFPQSCLSDSSIWTPSNTISWGHPSPQCRIFAQMTAECPIIYNGTPLPTSAKLSLPMGGSGPHLIHGFLDPPKSSTQTASRSVQLFLQGSLV